MLIFGAIPKFSGLKGQEEMNGLKRPYLGFLGGTLSPPTRCIFQQGQGWSPRRVITDPDNRVTSVPWQGSHLPGLCCRAVNEILLLPAAAAPQTLLWECFHRAFYLFQLIFRVRHQPLAMSHQGIWGCVPCKGTAAGGETEALSCTMAGSG